MTKSKNPSHLSQVPRINRALGQLEAIRRMVDGNAYCIDIMTQLRAVRNAIKTIELGVLEAHVGSCVAEVCHSTDEKLKMKRINEIMELLKKYE